LRKKLMDAGSSMRRWNQKGSVDRIVIAILLACSYFLSYSLRGAVVAA
jgi:hypothetical protein